MRWKRPLDCCAPWEHSVTQAMDRVTPHMATCIALSLAADVFWCVTSQSSESLLWDPRLHETDATVEGAQASVVNLHLEPDRAVVGAFADMDNSSVFDPQHPRPSLVALSSSLCSTSTPWGTSEADNVHRGNEAARLVHFPKSALRMDSDESLARGCKGSSRRRKVTFDDQIDFWFPAEDQVLLPRAFSLCPATEVRHVGLRLPHPAHAPLPAPASLRASSPCVSKGVSCQSLAGGFPCLSQAPGSWSAHSLGLSKGGSCLLNRRSGLTLVECKAFKLSPSKNTGSWG